MNNKYFYLSYKNDKGEFRREFNETIESIMKVEKFDIYEFFDNLNKIIKSLSPEVHQKFLQMVQHKPTYFFGLIYYTIKEYSYDEKLEEAYEKLQKYCDCKISLFMLMNFLREE